MKHAKLRFFSFLLALLLLSATISSCSFFGKADVQDKTGGDGQTDTRAETDSDTFVPVLRFAVISDIHTRIKGYENATQDEIDAAERRTKAIFTQTYSYAAADKNYGDVDAVVIAGDYTDYGRTGQIEAFLTSVNAVKQADTDLLVCIGNHEFWATGENGSNSTATTQTYALFRQYFGHEPDSHTVINGFHFIGISPDRNGGRNYTKAKANWLAAELEKAAADDPTGEKPIFVYQHISPAGSVYGSSTTTNANEAYACIDVGNVLKNYPQAVVFAGHAHRNITDEQALMQGDYTIQNTGSFAYASVEMYINDGSSTLKTLYSNTEGGNYEHRSDTYSEHGEKEASLFTIVEVDAQNRVRIQYHDADTDRMMQEPIIIDSIGHKEDFTLTKDRKDSSVAPTFSADAAVSVASLSPYTALLSFSQAECKNGIRNYKVELYSDGDLKRTIYRLSNDNTSLMPETLTAPFENLTPSTAYTVKIYGYNSWGKMTVSPLTYNFTTPNTDGILTPDLLSLKFNADGSAVNTVSGQTLYRNGTVSTVTDASLGNKTVGVLTGAGDWQWREIKDYYEICKQSLTLEAYVKLPSKPSSGYIDVVSNQQSGGIGFEFKSNGNMCFYGFILENDGYLSPRAVINTGEYVHLVGTVENGTVSIYINGVLAASDSHSGSIWWPMKYGSEYLSIGGDAYLNYESNNFMTGNIAAVNMYSYALSATDVATLYANIVSQ